jgi:hypothetical protein
MLSEYLIQGIVSQSIPKKRRYMMKATQKLVMLAALLGLMAGVAGEAGAYTFTFDDMAYVARLGTQQSLSGPAQLADTFPTYVAPPGYSSPGYYQVITTNNGTNYYDTNTTNPIPTYIGRYTAGGTTEFIQNDPNNLPGGLFNGTQYTEGQDRLSWSSSLAPFGGLNSQSFAKYLTTSTVGASFNFYGTQYNTTASFLFNGFDLKGTAGQQVTIQANDLNNIAISGDTLTLTLDGNWDMFHAIDWAGVGSINFINLGGGSISLDNVEINDPVPTPTPEPGTMMLLGVGMLGLAIYGKRRMNKES